MKGGTNNTVLVAILVLEAVLLAGLSLANDSGAIRLPTDRANKAALMSAGEGKQLVGEEEGNRPWDCCDHPDCWGRQPRRQCKCDDILESCPSGCRRCVEFYDPYPITKYRCGDMYSGADNPRPKCHRQQLTS